MNRRTFVEAGVACATLGIGGCISGKKDNFMYGLIAKITTTAGNRDALNSILLEATQNMPGCLSYIISKDATDQNVVWITENWDSQENHQASLKLPAVQAAIQNGRALIASMEPIATLEPVGGKGL